MSVRAGVAAVSFVISVAVLGAACSVPSSPTGPSPSPSPTTAASTLVQPGSPVSWLRVSPEQGAPGSAVSLDVACLDNLGAVHSPVLDVGALKGNPDGHQPWHLFGTGTVRLDAVPGRYPISATCGTDELSATFTVLPTRSR